MKQPNYLGSALRFFLICMGLGLFLFALKLITDNGYIAHGEWRRDALIWLVVSVALSLLSPALEKTRIGHKDSD